MELQDQQFGIKLPTNVDFLVFSDLQIYPGRQRETSTDGKLGGSVATGVVGGRELKAERIFSPSRLEFFTLMQMWVFWCWLCNQATVCQHADDNNSALFRGSYAAKIQLTQI